MSYFSQAEIPFFLLYACSSDSLMTCCRHKVANYTLVENLTAIKEIEEALKQMKFWEHSNNL